MAIPTSNMAKVTDLAFIKIDADSLKSLKTSRSDLTKLCNLVTKWSNLVINLFKNQIITMVLQ